MMFCAALTGPSLDAPIAATYDEATWLVIGDTDDLDHVWYVSEKFPEEMHKGKVEALLCGEIYNAEEFEKIAYFGVSRYQAAGMQVVDAIREMDAYRLPLIRDYVGGHGCGSHEGGECSCGDDHH